MCNPWKVYHKFVANVFLTKFLYPESLLRKHLTVIFEELTSKTAKSTTVNPICGTLFVTMDLSVCIHT